jgi:hypothetical protein
MDLIGSNLQPIVASRQQLIRASVWDTLQPMVVLTKQECRDAFSKRLDEAFEKIGKAPEKGRPTWVSKRYNKEISPESARKWLQAQSIPDMGHVYMICTDLQIHPTWLLTGLGPMLISDEVQSKDGHHNIVALAKPWPFPTPRKKYDRLSERQQGAIEEHIRAEVEKLGEAEKAKTSPKKGRG